MVSVKIAGKDYTFNKKTDITPDNIIAYAQEKGDTAWLKKEVSKKLTDKNDKKRNISYMELLNDFVNKYDDFNEFKPSDKPKEPSFIEKILAL